MAMRLIGQRAGITSERVRQIVLEEGLPPRLPALRQAQERRRAERLAHQQQEQLRRQQARGAAREQRMQRLQRFLLRAQRLWRQGFTVAAIAVAYRMPSNSMAWYIHSGRTRLGWFPRRA